MRLEDLMISAVFASAFTIFVLALWAYRGNLARGFPGFAAWIQRLRPWQALAVLAYTAILLYTFLNRYTYRDGLFFLTLMAGVAIGFAILWVREFLFLMALRDDDLPGRFDKPIWAAVLIALPPLGLFLFRLHRLAHWPEPEPKPRVSPAARELA
jgi:hypothetical protein